MKKKWIPIKAAADRAGISRQMVARLIKEGKVRAVRFGIGPKSAWKMEEAEVQRLVKAYKTGFANV